ncbi:hypothetical protein, partial [Clostridium chrysemydis]|uniref:hypothetical protein n=1 Tax=Clostridium chrysemydis TaxID=2665504 RepID=UPI003F40C53D
MKFFFKFLIIFYTIFTSNLYSNTSKIPNEKVFDNPKKEVTTVEAKKNKEHAEMNIKVNKLSIQKIEGYDIGNGKTQYFIPKEEKENKLLKNLTNNTENQYLIFETKEQLSDYLNKNKKAKKKRDIANPIQYEVMQDENQTMLTVNSNNDVYILDNKNNVYFGSVFARNDKDVLIMDFFLDENWLKYTYSSSRKEKVYSLKYKTGAKIFLNYTQSVRETAEILYMADGWGKNKHYTRVGNLSDSAGGVSVTLNNNTLNWEYDYGGVSYYTGKTPPNSYCTIPLNHIKGKKVNVVGNVDILENSEINFYEIVRRCGNYINKGLVLSNDLRLNEPGWPARLQEGQFILLRVINSNEYGEMMWRLSTDITINVNKEYIPNATVIKPNDSIDVQYTRVSSNMEDMGSYVNGGSKVDIYNELRRTYGPWFKLVCSDEPGLELYNYSSTEGLRPNIRINRDIKLGGTREKKVTAYLVVGGFPWGTEYKLRKYNITLKVTGLQAELRTLNLIKAIPNKEYIIDLNNGIGKTQEYTSNSNLDYNIHQISLGSGLNLSGVSRAELWVNNSNYGNSYSGSSYSARLEGLSTLKITKKNYSETSPLPIILKLYNSSGIVRVYQIDVTNIRSTRNNDYSAEIDPRFFKLMELKGENKLRYDGYINGHNYSALFNKTGGTSFSSIQSIASIDNNYNLANNNLITYNRYGFTKNQSPLNGYKDLNGLSLKSSKTPDTVNLLYLGTDNYYQSLNLSLTQSSNSSINMNKVYNGQGNINLKQANINTLYTFTKDNLNNNNGLTLSNRGEFITTGTSFNPNSDIVNKIIVNDNSTSHISGKRYNDNDIEITLGSNQISIKKLQEFTSLKSLKIDYYYNELKLGTYTLRITNTEQTSDVIIEGIDKINFGTLIP